KKKREGWGGAGWGGGGGHAGGGGDLKGALLEKITDPPGGAPKPGAGGGGAPPPTHDRHSLSQRAGGRIARPGVPDLAVFIDSPVQPIPDPPTARGYPHCNPNADERRNP